MLLAAPYLCYLRWQTGEWIISGKTGGHLLQGSRRAGERLAPSVSPLADGLKTSLTEAFVQLTKALRFEYELFNLIFPVAFVLLAALGLFRERWTRERAGREAYLFSFVAAAMAGYAVTLPNVRFLVPLLPLLLCWVSKGVVEFVAWATETLEAFRETRALNRARKKRRAARRSTAKATGKNSSRHSSSRRCSRRCSRVGLPFEGRQVGRLSRAEARRRMDQGARLARVPVIMSTVRSRPSTPEPSRHLATRTTRVSSRARGARGSSRRRNEREFKYMRLLQPLLEEAASIRAPPRAQPLRAPGHKILVYALEVDAGVAGVAGIAGVEPGAKPAAAEAP